MVGHRKKMVAKSRRSIGLKRSTKPPSGGTTPTSGPWSEGTAGRSSQPAKTPYEIERWLFGTEGPPSDRIAVDVRERLIRQLLDLSQRLTVVLAAIRRGENYQAEAIRIAAKWQRLASVWPPAEKDLAMPKGYAWCSSCDSQAKLGTCNYSGCPIRFMQPKRRVK